MFQAAAAARLQTHSETGANSKQHTHRPWLDHGQNQPQTQGPPISIVRYRYRDIKATASDSDVADRESESVEPEEPRPRYAARR